MGDSGRSCRHKREQPARSHTPKYPAKTLESSKIYVPCGKKRKRGTVRVKLSW